MLFSFYKYWSVTISSFRFSCLFLLLFWSLFINGRASGTFHDEAHATYPSPAGRQMSLPEIILHLSINVCICAVQYYTPPWALNKNKPKPKPFTRVHLEMSDAGRSKKIATTDQAGHAGRKEIPKRGWVLKTIPTLVLLFSLSLLSSFRGFKPDSLSMII